MSDITIAASKGAFEQLFYSIRDNFTFAAADSGSWSLFSASYSVAMHLEGGTIKLNDDGTIEVDVMDIEWDTLTVQVCFNLPGFCIPGFCIIPNPWNGCLLGLPEICFGGPICIPLDMSGLVSEISKIKAHLAATYFVDPGRLPGWSDLDAEVNGKPNKWRIFIDPDWVAVDPIDVPATMANVFENVVEAAINSLLPSWLPQWAKDVIWAIVGPVIDLIKEGLGILDNLEDWLEDLLGTTFNFVGQIETAVVKYLAKDRPIYELEDPFPVLPATSSLIPVKLPLRQLGATVNSHEMVVTADIG
jgi:hypothetical protein